MQTSDNKTTIFIREVAKYFMDFLETDFHKRKLPKRSIKLRNNDNLLVGLNLQKYPSFNKHVWKLVNHGFSSSILTKVEKGVYKTNLPKSLLDLIKLQIGKITSARVTTTVEKIANELEKAGTLYNKEYDVALTNSIEAASAIVRNDLVLPFIEQIEKPLQNLSLGDEDNVYLIEEELTDILLKLLESKISEVLNLFIAKNKINTLKELKSSFDLADVKTAILSFFEGLQVADLYAELFELERNRAILDKQDLYLYFGDISYGNVRYPIFYLPFSAIRQGDVMSLEFDSQVYINKKALEYVVQECNVQQGTVGNLKTVSERMIYLAQHQEDLPSVLDGILNELINFFELDGTVSVTNDEPKTAKGQRVRVSNTCYIGLSDKSDEALVNDYEDILQQLSQEEGALAEAFNVLLEDFIHKNPDSFNPEVENEWENAGTEEKLVFSSPIPLNSEQLQILSAIRKEGCKYIIVEGPPGTGKSHTITAIIFNAILENKSVLVLSDKKEALDVVEDKITQTMDKVRYGEDFQNPILRLGKTGSTYGQILAKPAIAAIKANFQAVHKNYATIEENINKSANSLKEDLEAEILAYKDVDIHEIHEYFDFESHFEATKGIFDVDEVCVENEAVIELEELRTGLRNLVKKLESKSISNVTSLLGKDHARFSGVESFQVFLASASIVSEVLTKTKSVFAAKIASVASFDRLTSGDLSKISDFMQSYAKLESWPFGSFFNRKKIEALDIQFKQNFLQSNLESAHKQLPQIKSLFEISSFVSKLSDELGRGQLGDVDLVTVIHQLLLKDDLATGLNEFVSLADEIKYLVDLINKYPLTAKIVGVDLDKFSSLQGNDLVTIADLDFDKNLRFISLKQKLAKDFSKIPELSYAARQKNIEQLVTTQVTHLLDGRLIDFCNNSKADAETLKNVIRSKQRFPKEEFQKLKQAFPCILAGIRDYAEYIPLEPEIFDLLIIDEASQVSIAQAFPALLRAKKILILGDKKQFSNIKAAQARGDTNREYLNNLETSFKLNISSETTKLIKLEKFNIKTSILEFFEFIRNYEIQLLKHFRGYKEIISYSNKFFYQESLQVMKIRGRSIDEVIKFSFVEPEEKDELYPNTNLKEVEFIISELRRLKDDGTAISVGIITPHTNQQKLLVEMISKLPERDHFFEKMQLKIMTFDTCQGEERDVIYYSMVASKHSDKLWGVFIKDLSSVDIEEDGQIKAQRLNVGFSRAKETVHLVLSKPIDEFSGSIGDALRHYYYALEEAKKERSTAEVDAKSKMEPEVLNWFYQTKFWKENKDRIEFIPQFEIGKYLRQLDQTYSHPAYKVDFLVVYHDEAHREHKIVIEYDGFREHFKDADEINEFNYQHYYSDADVYREKVLESYGYKFLRINRFNAGENPIATLDERIAKLVKYSSDRNPLLNNIHETIEGLQNGDMKECPKCKQVRDLKDFKDSSLLTGRGRFCSYCKQNGGRSEATSVKPPVVLSDQTCPRCGSRMVLRNGRKGKFYGCSKFPYCKGTKNI